MTDTVPIEAYEATEPAARANGRDPGGPPVAYEPDLELDLAHVALRAPERVPDLVAHGLRAEHFYRPALRVLVDAILSAHRAGQVVDVHTVPAHLPATFDRDILVDILARDVTTARLGEWVVRLSDLHAERCLDQALAEAQQARADGMPATYVRETLANLADVGPAAFIADPDLDDFLDTDEPAYDWVIDDLVERGDRTIVTGEEGMGKSTLLRQIGVQAAAGIHPFTGDDIEPLSVLIADCENSDRQVRRAMGPLRDAANGRPVNLRARILGHSIDLARPEVYDDLARRIDRYATDLLILGPVYKLTDDDPTKEVPARQVADALDRLRQIRGTALLLEAHTPYADGAKSKRPMRPYGASLWSRWPEFGIFLAPDGQLRHWRGQRDERAWPRKLTRAQPWPWMVDPDAPTDGEQWHGPTRCIEAVVEVLGEIKGEELSTNKLGAALRERGRSFRNEIVATAANQAADEGRIARRPGPRGSVLFSALSDTQGNLNEPF